MRNYLKGTYIIPLMLILESNFVLVAAHSQSPPQSNQQEQTIAAVNTLQERLKSMDLELQNDNLSINEISKLNMEIQDIQMSVLAPNPRSPLKGITGDEQSRILSIIKPMFQKILTRSEIARQQDEDIKRQKSGMMSRNAEIAVSKINLYSIAEACQQGGYAFDASEIEGIKSEVLNELNSAGVSQADRNKHWNAAQSAINQTGFRNETAYKLHETCAAMRKTLTYTFPKVLAKTESTPKNPF